MKKRCLGCMKEYAENENICPHCGYIEGTPTKEVYHITPGVTLAGRYLVGRVLGSGGFGITYIGYDNLLEQVVAMKEYLPAEFATRMPNQSQVTIYRGEPEEQFKAGLQKTLEETQRLAQFQNEPDILHVYDFFEENNTAYIVMEYLEGETLKDKLVRDGNMTVEAAMPIILTVLAALKKVHVTGIVHRDIAPDNIYLLKDGGVKLIDFGASRHAITTHTKSLTVILKIGYAPLEQYQSGGNQGPWTDIYALAATFYRMLVGRKPQEATERRLNDQLKEPSKLGVTINNNTENAIMNALNVKIEDRIKSAEEFESALLSSEVVRIDATPDNTVNVKWPLWLKAAVSGAAALVLVFVIALAVGLVGNYKVISTGSVTLAEDETRIPNIINMEQDAARTIIEKSGLKFEVGDSETSDKIKEGRVLGQTVSGKKINAGQTVKKGTVLSVTISSGKGTAQIPDVMWMKKEKAAEALKSSRLIVINYVDDTDTFAAQGIVTGIEPLAGSEVELKDTLTIKISTGEKQEINQALLVNVPDLTGQSQEDAYEALKNSGLFLEKSEITYSDTVPKGSVISQAPAPGTEDAHQGDIVTVIVSAGKESVEVPYLQNETQDNAAAILSGIGLVPDIQSQYDDTVQAGYVISQSIEAGTAVEKGTPVTIYVSMGAAPANQTNNNNNRPANGNSVTQPHTSKTQETQPAQTQPAQTQPVQTQPPQTQPAQTQPPATQPAAADPIWDIVGD